jgi:ATP-dependent helicase/nuclease subunit B
MHELLHTWGAKDGYKAGALIPRLRTALQKSALHPVFQTLWEPILAAVFETFEEKVRQGMEEGRIPVGQETKGTIEIAGIKLTGQADRIDRLPDGGLAIVDYKKGEAPTQKSIAKGFSLQLGLIGAIAEQGGFDGIAGEARVFEYWVGKKELDRRGEIKSATAKGEDKIEADAMVDHALAEFDKAADRFLSGDAAFTAKLHPDYARFHDYDQLMRLDEWRDRNG